MIGRAPLGAFLRKVSCRACCVRPGPVPSRAPSPRSGRPGRTRRKSPPACAVMLSSISVPEKSLHPALSVSAARSTPSLTHEVCRLSIYPRRNSRERRVHLKVENSLGRRLGDQSLAEEHGVLVDEAQRHELGEAVGLLLDVAQQVQMVDDVARTLDVAVHDRRGGGTPSACAVVMISTQAATSTFLWLRISRTLSSRISAAVPGIDPSPASRSIAIYSGYSIRTRRAPYMISIGEKAWIWISGKPP